MLLFKVLRRSEAFVASTRVLGELQAYKMNSPKPARISKKPPNHKVAPTLDCAAPPAPRQPNNAADRGVRPTEKPIMARGVGLAKPLRGEAFTLRGDRKRRSNCSSVIDLLVRLMKEIVSDVFQCRCVERRVVSYAILRRRVKS